MKKLLLVTFISAISMNAFSAQNTVIDGQFDTQVVTVKHQNERGNPNMPVFVKSDHEVYIKNNSQNTVTFEYYYALCKENVRENCQFEKRSVSVESNQAFRDNFTFLERYTYPLRGEYLVKSKTVIVGVVKNSVEDVSVVHIK